MRKILPILTLIVMLSACDISPGALAGRPAVRTEPQAIQPTRDSVYQGECSSIRVDTPTLKAAETGTETEACRMPRYAIQSVGAIVEGNKVSSYRLGLRPIPGTENKPKYAELKEFTLRNWQNRDLVRFECQTSSEAADRRYVDCRPIEIVDERGARAASPTPLYLRMHEASGAYVAHQIQVKNPDCEATVTYTDPYADKMGQQGCSHGDTAIVFGADRTIDDMSFGEVNALSAFDSSH